MATEDDQRRADVWDALGEGLDKKTLMGGTDRALGLLKAAYDRARQPVPLAWPWPQLTAFRLAYVRMRTAKTRSELSEVDRLLSEAADGERALDPLQHALHVVVLRRLLELAKRSTDRDLLKDRINTAFKELLAASRNSSPGRFEHPIHDDLSSLVELLGFLIGGDYELEGLGQVIRAQFPESHGYVLVSNQCDYHKVRLTRHLAQGEFEDRIKRGSVDLAFKWEAEDYVPRIVYPPSDGKLPETIVSKLLPDICLSLPRTTALGKVEKVHQKEPEKHLDSNLKRIRETISGILPSIGGIVLGHTEVIPSLSRGNNVYAFYPTLRVLGLVSLKCWSPSD